MRLDTTAISTYVNCHSVERLKNKEIGIFNSQTSIQELICDKKILAGFCDNRKHYEKQWDEYEKTLYSVCERSIKTGNYWNWYKVKNLGYAYKHTTNRDLSHCKCGRALFWSSHYSIDINPSQKYARKMLMSSKALWENGISVGDDILPGRVTSKKESLRVTPDVITFEEQRQFRLSLESKKKRRKSVLSEA